MRTDTQTQSDVLSELKWNARVNPNETGVAVKDGVVTLTGCVDSYIKKWLPKKLHRMGGEGCRKMTSKCASIEY